MIINYFAKLMAQTLWTWWSAFIYSQCAFWKTNYSYVYMLFIYNLYVNLKVLLMLLLGRDYCKRCNPVNGGLGIINYNFFFIRILDVVCAWTISLQDTQGEWPIESALLICKFPYFTSILIFSVPPPQKKYNISY